MINGWLLGQSTDVHRPTQRCFETAGTVRRDTICKQVIVQLTTGVAPAAMGPWDGEKWADYEQIDGLADEPGRCAEDASITSITLAEKQSKRHKKTSLICFCDSLCLCDVEKPLVSFFSLMTTFCQAPPMRFVTPGFILYIGRTRNMSQAGINWNALSNL